MKSKFLSLFTVFLCGISTAHAKIELTSTDITDGGVLKTAQVFNGFGCTGENISPQLSWTGVPENTKSLAITIYDPDAPTGSGWWHWLAFNIPTTAESIASGASLKSMPDGTIESRTDYGAAGFGGACPPVGDKPHRYIVTLYALNTDKLDLDANATAAMVGFSLNATMIEKTSITATFGR